MTARRTKGTKRMSKLLTFSAITAMLMLGTAGEAAAWSHTGSVVGPRGGTTTYGGSGSCAGGACSSQGGGTLPSGRTWSRQGTTTCANGACTSNGTLTGP